jgi:hypothetical protein
MNKEFSISIINYFNPKEIEKAREILENFFENLIKKDCPNTTIIVKEIN